MNYFLLTSVKRKAFPAENIKNINYLTRNTILNDVNFDKLRNNFQGEPKHNLSPPFICGKVVICIILNLLEAHPPISTNGLLKIL